MDALTTLVNDPKYHDVLSLVKGFRNGLVYGTKIRFPHALVMTFLFRNGTLKDKALAIFKATKTHARNLAFFVTAYKTTMLILRRLNGNQEHTAHAFLAGVCGGYVVFGENNAVNKQISLYVFARVVLALANMVVSRGVLKQEPTQTFPVFTALSWGMIMWLFRHERVNVQPSLQASMQYLYLDSNHWTGLRNFLWHNR